MIKQPERGTRNVNDSFYESEQKRIKRFNEALGDVELTKRKKAPSFGLPGGMTA